MMGGMRSKYLEEFHLMQFVQMNKKFVYQVGNNKKSRVHVKRSRDKKHGLIYSLGISKSKAGLKEVLILWRLKSVYIALRFLFHISQSQRVLALDILTRECCLGK